MLCALILVHGQRLCVSLMSCKRVCTHSTHYSIDEMKSPVVDAKPHLRTNGTVNVTWTTPNNIKPTKSIIRYRNVLSADTLEKVVEGSSTAVEINNLEMGATYMFSVAIYAASSSKRASHSVSSFSEPVYVTTYSGEYKISHVCLCVRKCSPDMSADTYCTRGRVM